MVQLREKNVPNGRQNLKLTRNDLVSVSISFFRRCYDALCGDTVVSVLRQHFSDVRAFCAISLFTFFFSWAHNRELYGSTYNHVVGETKVEWLRVVNAMDLFRRK